jgi:hypothetical protein
MVLSLRGQSFVIFLFWPVTGGLEVKSLEKLTFLYHSFRLEPATYTLKVMNFLEGPTELALSFIGGVHIGTRALLDINLLWFGYTRSQWGGGGCFTR